ncbi:unnamed protein product [Onchocerca ochengi]|uniref:Uncharacterized protein n=1 Tax=Onchocerca ochengi TaxID=42157 RepID=A0A182E816_ONCOC|nr:unnamed protein product [Onchocerca ochengi]
MLNKGIKQFVTRRCIMTADSVAWQTMAGARDNTVRLRVGFFRVAAGFYCGDVGRRLHCITNIRSECRDNVWQGTIVNRLWVE